MVVTSAQEGFGKKAGSFTGACCQGATTLAGECLLWSPWLAAPGRGWAGGQPVTQGGRPGWLVGKVCSATPCCFRRNHETRSHVNERSGKTVVLENLNWLSSGHGQTVIWENLIWLEMASVQFQRFTQRYCMAAAVEARARQAFKPG